MIMGLAIACGVLFCASVALVVLYFKVKSSCRHIRAELTRFEEVRNLEQHAREQTDKASAALGQIAKHQLEIERLEAVIATRTASITSLDAELRNQQSALANTAQMLGEYRTLEELRKQIDEQKNTSKSEGERLEAEIATRTATITSLNSEVEAQQRALKDIAQTLGEYRTLEGIRTEIEKQKNISNRYNQLLGNFKTADELKAHIEERKQRINELNQTIGKFKTLPELDQHIAVQEARIRELNEVLGGADSVVALQARIKSQESVLAQVQAQIMQVEEAREMQEFGFYRPRYDFDSSSKYQEELDRVRDRQTGMVKSDSAVSWEKTWTVEGSAAEGRKMMKEQGKLMLRAFNGECDAAVAKVKYNNATTLESRIERSCEQINKLGKTNSASITDAFLKLKLEELHLVHDHRVKQQQEKEEQQRIRDQMREEEKARREIEDAQERAVRDEELGERALEKARRALDEATRGQREATEETKTQNAALAAQVAKLENELKDAIDRKAKAIARAQLTSSGYIYVLSNVGSFGQDVYKLGMTRRLDPLERVKELGDASVPFPFDVHAVVYSENAPELESKLHRHFADRRLNLVNLRREYFRVTLEEVIAAVGDYFGQVTFVKFPEAAEYRESMAKRKSDGNVMSVAASEVRAPSIQVQKPDQHALSQSQA